MNMFGIAGVPSCPRSRLGHTPTFPTLRPLIHLEGRVERTLHSWTWTEQMDRCDYGHPAIGIVCSQGKHNVFEPWTYGPEEAMLAAKYMDLHFYCIIGTLFPTLLHYEWFCMNEYV